MAHEIEGPRSEWASEPDSNSRILRIHDNDVRPHWKTYGTGYANLDANCHLGAPWLTLRIEETPEEGRSKQAWFHFDPRKPDERTSLTALRDFITAVLDAEPMKEV